MRRHVVPMSDVQRANARTDMFINLLVLALVLILGLIVVAGALECSPLAGGQLCEGRVPREGLGVLKGLLGW